MICLILVFIIDISGIIDEIKHLIWKVVVGKKRQYQSFKFKPVECSLCMTWWCGLIYLCFTTITWYYVAYVALLALLTPVFRDTMLLIKDILTKIIETIYDIFNI